MSGTLPTASAAFHPTGPLHSWIHPPGSKSITNRALVIAGLAEGGASTLWGALDADDTKVMRAALTALGIPTAGQDPVVVGPAAPPPAERRIDVGASGTTARFIAAVAAVTPGRTVIDGTERMRERPIADLVDALRSLGVGVDYLGSEGVVPIAVDGLDRPPETTTVAVDGSVSSQFVTALMMVAPRIGVRRIELVGPVISRPYLHTTAEVMGAFGVEVRVEESVIEISGGAYRPAEFAVEPDASAAVYPWAAAAITAGAIRVEGLRRASRQADIGALGVLEAMGCTIFDGAAGITVRRTDELRGVVADLEDCPDASLGLAVVAALADGESRFTGLGSLRVKETDRLAALETELRRLGVDAWAGDGELRIQGTGGRLQPGLVATYDDHRMAMAFAVAGLAVEGVAVADPECVSKTWPRFFEDMAAMIDRSHTVVAIDGPSGSGKTTVSRNVAARLGWAHLDTGAFYRAATVAVLSASVDPTDADRVAEVVASGRYEYRGGAMFLDGRDVSAAIRSSEVTAAVSAVSAIPTVRRLMVARQREWVQSAGRRAVVEGRDIGTVVFPEAAVKVYLTASEEVRAARRAGEQGDVPERVAADLRRRDTADSSRAVSPLEAAPDAAVLDTSDMGIDEAVDRIVGMVAPLLDV